MPQTSFTSQQLDAMTILQNRWYNGFTTGLQADPAMAQFIQPALPMPQNDAGLVVYENFIPPTSLTFNINWCCCEQFFNEYAAVISELVFPENAFKQDIGVDTYQQWEKYVNQIVPSPTPGQLPALFQQWAIVNAPDVVQIGTSDLTQMALIYAAQQSLTPYIGPHAKPVDFNGGFTQLQQTLQQSSGIQFSFDSSTSSSDVSHTWPGGVDVNFYGLWTGCSNTSRLSSRFARSQVKVTVSAERYTVWTSVPGSWYNSSLLNDAYNNPFKHPWPPHANPSWEDSFGSQGSLKQLIISLLVIDGIHIKLNSDVTCTSFDQQIIQNNASHGMWPFFMPSSDGIVTNKVSFDPISGMQIDTNTQLGNPIVIGANVLGIARYLGHSNEQYTSSN